MKNNRRITNIEQAKSYFYKWDCSRFQMAREVDEEYLDYHKIATPELEKKWVQELYDSNISGLIFLSNNLSYTAFNNMERIYDKTIDLLLSKERTEDDIIKLLEASKKIVDLISNPRKIFIQIIRKIIPHTIRLKLINEAQEFLKIAKASLAKINENEQYDEDLHREYEKCVGTIKRLLQG